MAEVLGVPAGYLLGDDVKIQTSTVEDGMYRVMVTEKQLAVIQTALEEWFRLRMGQEFGFCNDMASINDDLSPENPNHEWIFDRYIERRNHLSVLLRAFFTIAFEPEGWLQKKTEDMLVAEDLWDSIRCARGISRWGQPLHVGPEPMPKIEKG